MGETRTPARRELNFATLDDAVRDAEHLLAAGYDRAGDWDLAQVCGHLTEWLRYPMDGYPVQPAPVRLVLWAIRKTVGPAKRREILATGKMPAGKPTLRESVAPPGGDPAEAVAGFRETVRRFRDHPGPFHPSPVFGAMARDEWLRLNAAHAAHHLSFLVPRT